MTESDQTQVDEQTSSPTEPEFVSTWDPDATDVVMELGFAGTCNECDIDMVEDDTGNTRLKCPDCGMIVGFVARYPDVNDGGVGGEAVEWPSKETDWDIEDGRATVAYFVRGTHEPCDAEFVKNAKEAPFGTTDLAC